MHLVGFRRHHETLGLERSEASNYQKHRDRASNEERPRTDGYECFREYRDGEMDGSTSPWKKMACNIRPLLKLVHQKWKLFAGIHGR